MAENYLITGYRGEPHVTVENDRGINAGVFGEGRCVLDVGKRFKAEYIGNNTIRVYDGKLMNQGAAAGIPAGEYIDLLIANAGQGMKRNDLIVFQYSKDASSLVESGAFLVVQGVETNGTPADPEIVQGDLIYGNAALDQMPLWRVTVSGPAISAPEQIFVLASNINGSFQTDLNEIASLENNFRYVDYTSTPNSSTLIRNNMISRAGRVINMNFVVTPVVSLAGSADEVLIFTLPEGYRPATNLATLCSDAGRALWLCRVHVDGSVTFSQYRKSFSEYSAAGTSVELACSMTWVAAK